jgi:hypothetical protein
MLTMLWMQHGHFHRESGRMTHQIPRPLRAVLHHCLSSNERQALLLAAVCTFEPALLMNKKCKGRANANALFVQHNLSF